MTTWNTVEKRLTTLIEFTRRKAKLVTNRRIKISIVVKLKTDGHVTLASIKPIKDESSKRYYYQLLIHHEVFERLPVDEIKGIILHELSHIPAFESIISGKLNKEHGGHGKEFKCATKKLNVPKKYACARSDVDRPERRIVRIK